MEVKKTLQDEIKSNNGGSSGAMEFFGTPSNFCSPAILIPLNIDNNSYQSNNISRKVYEMDQVKFCYLKHVVLKLFLLNSRENPKYLIKAVTTLLYLSNISCYLLFLNIFILIKTKSF